MKQSYTLHEVIDKADKKQFLEFPPKLYRRDKNYVRPLDEEVEGIFDKVKNKKLRQGEVIRWLLQNENQEIVGRIAAFYDQHTAKNNAQPTGGCGFFDCINDQDAANILFDAAREWLERHGMEAMDGSINFGDRDNFWGVLVDGFYEPLFNMPYNYPYYKNLFEQYGFQNYFNQYTFKREVSSENIKEVIREKARRISSNPDYSFRMISWKNIDKFADDFMTIYNNAWAVIPGVKKITHAHALSLLNKMKPILDPRLVHYGYYKDEPVAFFIMMQDLNQIIKRFNGKMNWLNKLRFMYHLKVRKSCTRIIGRIFGIVPEHQGKGVDGALIEAFEKVASLPGFPYKDLEMNWIGDFNPAMLKVVENIGGMLHKTHVTYRYLFDRSKPFERARKEVV
jgi:GNAT superfamily N-acetyltransferase